MAIGEAFEAIRRGYVDVALTAGYDSMLDLDRLEMFGNSGLVTAATDPAGAGRPFDRRRDGFVPGEGAGALLLESLDSARARGATHLRRSARLRRGDRAAIERQPGAVVPRLRERAHRGASTRPAGNAGGGVHARPRRPSRATSTKRAALKAVFGAAASTIAGAGAEVDDRQHARRVGQHRGAPRLCSRFATALLPPTINLTRSGPGVRSRLRRRHGRPGRPCSTPSR